MLNALKKIFAGKPDRSVGSSGRKRLYFDEDPSVIYAVGDIHGCLNELRSLVNTITRDAEQFEGEKWLIFLGDYVDRGPFSAGVIDYLTASAPKGFRRICLAGNHEEAFLDFVDSGCKDNGWLSFGGGETLASYGLYQEGENRKGLSLKIEACVPSEHLTFLRELPILIKTPSFCFVHAGIDPRIAVEDQPSKTLLWSRPSQFDWDTANLGFQVIHGHTPVKAPEISSGRVNVDIGAYANGKLAAARIVPGDQIRFLYSN